MPKLPTFTAEIGPAPASGGRRATPQDFGQPGSLIEAGHKVQKFALTKFEDTEEQEARKALISSSEIRAKYARTLDEAALNGGDTDKIKEQMQDELSKVGDEFVTRKGAQALQLYSTNTELMFDEQANRIRITRAAIQARVDGSKFLNAESELLRSDPTHLANAEKNAEAFAQTLKNISPEKKAEIAQGLKKELNMAAAVASARLDPEKTKQRLEAGEWDLTPEQREAATSKADTEVRARRADEAYQRSVKEYEEREADGKARDKHFADIMGGTATRRSIMDDADLLPQTREHLIVFMEQRAKALAGQEKASDQGVKRDLWLRIHAPDSDPRKIFNGDAIFDAVKKGRINTTDANNLNTLVANQKDENNRTIGSRLASVSSTVQRAIQQDPQFIGQPALVAEILNDYTARVFEKVKEYRDAKKNPNDIFTAAAGKDYIGSREFVQASIDSAKERQRAAMPKVPDLREKPDAWREIAEGATFIDPKGQQRVMTKALKDALEKQGAPGAPAAREKPKPEGLRSNPAGAAVGRTEGVR